MNSFILLFVIPFAVLLPAYIRAERQTGVQGEVRGEAQGGFRKAMVLKLALSGLCSLCAVLGFAFWAAQGDLSRVFVVAALLCAIPGDCYLQFVGLDEKKFNKGIFWFAITQYFLIQFLYLLYGFSWLEFAIAVIVCVGAYLLVIRPGQGPSQTRVSLTAYTFLLALMASKAVIALFGAATPTLPVSLMAAGAVLFALSDLLQGIKLSKPGDWPLYHLNLIVYFCGLLLIALSTNF